MWDSPALLNNALHLVAYLYLLTSLTPFRGTMPSLVWFIAFALAGSLALWMVVLAEGFESLAYFHGYYLLCLGHFGFRVYLLIAIQRGIRMRWTWRSNVLLTVFLSVFAWHILWSEARQATIYTVLIALALHVEAFLCASLNLALSYTRRLRLPRPYGAVLIAISATVFLYYFTYTTEVFGLVPFSWVRPGIPYISLLFWLLLIYGLRFAPPSIFQAQQAANQR